MKKNSKQARSNTSKKVDAKSSTNSCRNNSTSKSYNMDCR